MEVNWNQARSAFPQPAPPSTKMLTTVDFAAHKYCRNGDNTAGSANSLKYAQQLAPSDAGPFRVQAITSY
jgi:hypothetical protein